MLYTSSISSLRGFQIEKSLQENREARSLVYLARRNDELWVVKFAPKYLLDNEEWALAKMRGSYAPERFKRLNLEVIAIEYIEPTPLGNKQDFMKHYETVLEMMRRAGLRHGDLTKQSVIVHRDVPVIVDWAESRVMSDPRPDKRPGGDAFWLKKTMEEICQLAK